MARNKKRGEAADVKAAVKAGKLKRQKARKVTTAEARILSLARDRYDRETFALLQGLHVDGIGLRDLLVLAQMEYLDITHDMDSGKLGTGEGYRLRTQVLETLRKLAESESGGGAALPNLIQINIGETKGNRSKNAGKPLEMAS